MDNLPWLSAAPLDAEVFEALRLDTIFDCDKWDPQFEDVSVLARFPLILKPDAWQTLADLAERLAAETLAAEKELITRPDLMNQLGLPNAIAKLWRKPPKPLPDRPDVRLVRFDFHYTPDGWRISEANADTPSGFIEASCFTANIARHFPDHSTINDPTRVLAQAIRDAVGEGACVALIHATAYSDDRQVMLFISRYLEAAGLKPILISPAQIRWEHERAVLDTEWQTGAVDFMVRFFPAEWMPNMPRATGWQHYFGQMSPPACNPTTALLVQSKRFPLVWDSLKTPLPTWRAMLPETREPRSVEPGEGWVVKPILGRAGEEIGIEGITPPATLKKLWQAARKHPKAWIAQRRFTSVPFVSAGENWYPCVGVYTINGRAAGAYGRLGSRPITDGHARDVAVLVASSIMNAAGEP